MLVVVSSETRGTATVLPRLFRREATGRGLCARARFPLGGGNTHCAAGRNARRLHEWRPQHGWASLVLARARQRCVVERGQIARRCIRRLRGLWPSEGHEGAQRRYVLAGQGARVRLNPADEELQRLLVRAARLPRRRTARRAPAMGACMPARPRGAAGGSARPALFARARADAREL